MTEKKQNETKASDNPVLLVKDIVQRTGKLDRELMYLLNKVKYYVPKAKPAGIIRNYVNFVSIASTFHERAPFSCSFHGWVINTSE